MEVTQEQKINYINALVERLRNFEKQNWYSVLSLAKQCGIHCSQNELMQLSETAIVMACRDVASDDSRSIRERYDELVEIYEAQPVISPKDTVAKLFQQYSTPAPLAFLAGEYVKMGGRANKNFLEPSAGNGLLTIALPVSWTTVNEIDPVRVDNLELQDFHNIFSEDASKESFLPNLYFDGIITNPPFAKIVNVDKQLHRSELVGDNLLTYTFDELDHKMAILALEQMHNDGKASIIIGGKLHEKYYNEDGRLFGRLKMFITYLNRQYNLEDVIFINGEQIYRRQGTTYPIILLLINGRREWVSDKKHQWHTFNPALDTPIQTFEELFERIMPRLTAKKVDDLEKIAIAKAKMKIAKAKIAIARSRNGGLEGGNMFEYFKGSINELVSISKKAGNKFVKMIVGKVTDKLITDLQKKNVKISDEYKHTIDNSSIKHVLNNHGNDTEKLRGQIKVTVNDFNKIPDIVTNYDTLRTIKRNGITRIVYSKTYSNNTTLYFEEVRTKRKELAMVTLYKKNISSTKF